MNRTYEPFITTDIEATSSIRRFVHLSSTLHLLSTLTSLFHLFISAHSYVALRWCRPSTRKKSKKKSSGDASPDLNQTSPEGQGQGVPLPPVTSTTNGGKYTDSPVPAQQPVIREGKTLTGFIVAEHDVRLPSFFPSFLPSAPSARTNLRLVNSSTPAPSTSAMSSPPALASLTMPRLVFFKR
jgi:hypothetical protein